MIASTGAGGDWAKPAVAKGSEARRLRRRPRKIKECGWERRGRTERSTRGRRAESISISFKRTPVLTFRMGPYHE